MKKLIWLIGFVFFAAGPVFAGIPVQSGDFTGSRTTPAGSGVDATGGYADANGGFTIEWTISFDGSYWNYSYIFTDKDGSTLSPDMSHWIVEISPEIPFEDIEEYIFNANATVQTPGGSHWPADPNFPDTTQAGANNGNPNLGTDLVGVKFDTASNAVNGTYTFQSVEPPIWGDFYAK